MARSEWLLLFLVLSALSLACSGGSKTRTPNTVVLVPVTRETIRPAGALTAATGSPAPTPDLAAAARAAGCSITPYDGGQPSGFAAPFLYPDWYSGDGLWLAPISLTALGLPRTPGPWYAGPTTVAIVTPSGAQGEPTLSGRRLDGSASLSVRSGGEKGVFILDLPAPGCWQVSVTDAGHELELTAFVQSLSLRPDVAGILATHRELQPYPIPSSCAATPWKGPEDRVAPIRAEYWLDGDGIMAGSRSGILWAGATNLLEWWPKLMTTVTVSGYEREDPSATLRVSLNNTSGPAGEYWTSTLVFPFAGCWEISASAGSQNLTASVYVYPEVCNHRPGTPTPTDCPIPRD